MVHRENAQWPEWSNPIGDAGVLIHSLNVHLPIFDHSHSCHVTQSVIAWHLDRANKGKHRQAACGKLQYVVLFASSKFSRWSIVSFVQRFPQGKRKASYVWQLSAVTGGSGECSLPFGTVLRGSFLGDSVDW